MKIAVIGVLHNNQLQFFPESENDRKNPEFDWAFRGKFLGYIDLPIEKPKKTVTKEAENFGIAANWFDSHKFDTMAFKLPKNAKNIKCTYEIEE